MDSSRPLSQLSAPPGPEARPMSVAQHRGKGQIVFEEEGPSMKKLMSTLTLTGLALVLTATPIVQKFLHSPALGSAFAAEDQQGQSGPNEPDGDNNDCDGECEF